jgi:hypothetical protein
MIFPVKVLKMIKINIALNCNDDNAEFIRLFGNFLHLVFRTADATSFPFKSGNKYHSQFP